MGEPGVTSQRDDGDRPDAGPLRVIIADDDPLARRMVHDTLHEAGLIVVAEACDGREACELVFHYRPDIVLVDVMMPEVDGLTATRRIIARHPETCVVLFTAAGDEEVGLLGLRMGASGFLTKDLDVSTLPRILESAHAGEAAVSRKLTMRLIQGMRRVRDDGTGLRPVRSTLTDREWEVLDLLGQGLTTEEISDSLFLALETVRSHVKNVMRKLGVSSRAEAIEVLEHLRADLLTRDASGTRGP